MLKILDPRIIHFAEGRKCFFYTTPVSTRHGEKGLNRLVKLHTNEPPRFDTIYLFLTEDKKNTIIKILKPMRDGDILLVVPKSLTATVVLQLRDLTRKSAKAM